MRDPAVLSQYLAENNPTKLHLGCGNHMLSGWLNSDLVAPAEGIYLDATQRFPLPDCSFDYVYSEHMIEHVSYPHGQRMLSECMRVLRKGGVLRVATPDLAFVIALYDANDQLRSRYIQHSTDEHILYAPLYADTFVINNFVRDWGHQFIYDKKILFHSMRTAGFADVKRCDLNVSEHPALNALANDGRMPDRFLELETLVVEGTKS